MGEPRRRLVLRCGLTIAGASPRLRPEVTCDSRRRSARSQTQIAGCSPLSARARRAVFSRRRAVERSRAPAPALQPSTTPPSTPLRSADRLGWYAAPPMLGPAKVRQRPSTPRRIGAWRPDGLVGGACAYDLSAPANRARLELSRSLRLSGRTQIVRLKGCVRLGVSRAAVGAILVSVETSRADIRCGSFRSGGPGIASAPRGKSLGNMGGAEVSLGQ